MIIFAGGARTNNIDSNLVDSLLTYGDCVYRENLSVRIQHFVDGQGTERITRHLMGDANI